MRKRIAVLEVKPSRVKKETHQVKKKARARVIQMKFKLQMSLIRFLRNQRRKNDLTSSTT